MFPKNKWSLNNNIIKVNKLKLNNIKLLKKENNFSILKSQSINNYSLNMEYANQMSIKKNTDKSQIDKFNQITKLNTFHSLNNPYVTVDSKFFENKDNKANSEKKINLISYYRHNKYLIPMIEKNKIKKYIFKNENKESPRQNKESSRAELQRDKNYFNLCSYRTNYSLDKIKPEFFEKNTIENGNNNNCEKLYNHKYSHFLTESSINKKPKKKFSNYKLKYIKSLFNNESEQKNLYYNDNKEGTKDKINEKYYIRKTHIISKNKKNKINFKNDFDNYLQNKKLFFIYRAKLFKLLYRTLNKILYKIKFDSFEIIKRYYIDKESNIQKILQRIYPKQKYINNKDNLNLNNFMNGSKSCIYYIKDKNENEINKKSEKSELCRNKEILKEKYEEIQKRKHLNEDKNNIYNEKIINIFTKNKKFFDSNTNKLKGIYKKKKLHNKINKSINNQFNKNISINNDKSISNISLKYNTLEMENIKSNKDITKNYMTYRENNNKNINKSKNNNDKLNKFFIRKIIKKMKSEDNRLYININYFYLSNTEIKGKKNKYNNNLKIYQSDNFSIFKKTKIKNIVNKDKIIGIIEEESSNINYTNDSNNSTDKNESKIKIIKQDNNKYLFSCVNFILKSIKRVMMKNYYEFYKKQMKFML